MSTQSSTRWPSKTLVDISNMMHDTILFAGMLLVSVVGGWYLTPVCQMGRLSNAAVWKLVCDKTAPFRKKLVKQPKPVNLSF